MKGVDSCGDLKEPAKVAIALTKERGSPHFHYDFGDPSGHEFGDPQRNSIFMIFIKIQEEYVVAISILR